MEPIEATLLLVEDDPILQELYLDRFVSVGFHVIQATDGVQALELLQQHPEIALVLLDVMLPKVSGYDVLMKIRHTPETKDLPVIVVSALADVDDQARAMQLGATDYITKGEMLPGAVIEKIKQYAISIPRPEEG